MPIKVRCQCGQEIVIRYGEWLYVLVALAILASLVNAVVLAILASRLSSIRSDDAEATASPPTALPATTTSPPARTSPTGGPATAAETSEIRSPDDSNSGLDEPPAIGWSDAPPPEGAVRELLAQLDLLPAEEGVAPEPPRDAEATTAVVASAPLVRLELIASGSLDREVVFAMLSDPDSIVRRRAVEQARQRLDAPPLASSEVALVQRAERLIREHPDGATVVGSIAGADAAASVDWADLAGRAARALAANETAAALDARTKDAAARGLDIVFILDTTRSMGPALTSVRDTARWLLPALEWALPESRFGLLLFKDEVAGTYDLSAFPSRDLMPELMSTEAQGGGDVPEGVLLAIESALSLGPFQWRDSARKHLVLITDQEPRRSEKRAIRTLAGAIRHEDDFRLHTIFTPSEDDTTGRFYAELSSGEIGRFASGAEAPLAAGLLRGLFEDDSLAATVEERLRESFDPDAPAR